MTPPKKRPKVRYVVRFTGFDPSGYMVCHSDYGDSVYSHVCDCDTATSAKRIAAALNVHEAHKRGEL